LTGAKADVATDDAATHVLTLARSTP